jgi:hypothetical protein
MATGHFDSPGHAAGAAQPLETARRYLEGAPQLITIASSHH